MNITPVQQNNTNFGKLYAPGRLSLNPSKVCGKVSRSKLLKSAAIKECAEKYDVYVRKGEKSGVCGTYRNSVIGGDIGLAIPFLFSLAGVSDLTCVLLTLAMFPLGSLIGAIGTHTPETYAYHVKGKKGDIETKEQTIINSKDIENISGLTQEIEAQLFDVKK